MTISISEQPLKEQPLYSYQQREVDCAEKPAIAMFFDPRTGKTRAAISAARELHRLKGASKFLVVAPKLAAQTTWLEHLEELWPEAVVVNLSDGKLGTRISKISTYYENLVPYPPILFVIVNVDILPRITNELLRVPFDGVIVDELHLFKTTSSSRTRALMRLSSIPWKRGLTGTPTPRSWLDIFAQYRFLDSSIFGRSITQFRRKYIISNPRFPSQIDGYVNADELKQKVETIAHIVKREDYHEIPDIQHVIQHTPLPSDVRSTYDKIVRNAIQSMGDYDLRHKFTQLLVLSRLTGGFAPGTTGLVHDAKLAATWAEIEPIVTLGKNAVVYYRFEDEGYALYDFLYKKNVPAFWLHGKTPTGDRSKAIEDFGTKHQVLVAQMQITALGVSLKVADTAIYYSHGYNYAEFKQSQDRIWKPGGKLTYVYLRAPNTVDEYISKIVSTKAEMSNALLSGVEKPEGFIAAMRGGQVLDSYFARMNASKKDAA